MTGGAAEITIGGTGGYPGLVGAGEWVRVRGCWSGGAGEEKCCVAYAGVRFRKLL